MRPQKLLARDDDEREHTKLLLKGFESDGESSLSLNLACALVKDHILKNQKAFIEGSQIWSFQLLLVIVVAHISGL